MLKAATLPPSGHDDHQPSSRRRLINCLSYDQLALMGRSAPAGRQRLRNRARYKAWASSDMALADAFAAHNPSARVVKIADADHRVFESNPDDMQREMTAFMNGLR